MTSDIRSSVANLVITVSSSSDVLGVDTNETYALSVTATGAHIEAATVYGAMHALQSLCQLVEIADDGITHQVSMLVHSRPVASTSRVWVNREKNVRCTP